MITVTGTRDLAAKTNVNPQSMLERIAAGFKQACPNTFSFKLGGTQKISGYDGHLAFVGCGTVRLSAKKHSKSALLVAINGSADYYTIQWAERGMASKQPIALDEEKWTDRFKQLNPIKLCPRVAGETPPYPSCSGQK